MSISTASTATARRERTVAVALISGAVLVNAAFVGLGAVFDYPQVLQRPGATVLRLFAEREATVSVWFLLLAAGAAMLAPIAVGLRSVDRSALVRAAVPVGIAAAAVQVLGLLRWPLIAPVLARTGDVAAFDLLNRILGTLVGETVGYTLTAAWTVLVALGLRAHLLGTPLAVVGVIAGLLILTGVLVPLGLHPAALTNFVGYVLWSLWSLALAARILWRARLRGTRVER